MADSKRKTANLFDATAVSKGRINSSTGAIEYAEDTPTLTYSDTNNEFTITTRYAWRGFVTEYLDLQEKPAFSYISDDGTFYMFPYAYDANKNYLGAIQSSVPTGTKYIRVSIQCSTVITNAKIKNIMVNEGSTPLPYEPYGWLHSLRKLGNATDTITTLPIDLYADGTNATVGLQGNMSQSGTPTPQNPIQPSETGDRTANIIEGVLPYTYIESNGLIKNDTSQMYDCVYAKVDEGETYYLSGRNGAYGFYADKPILGSISMDNTRYFGDTATIPSGCNYLVVRTLHDTSNAMITKGSIAPSSYIPTGYKLTISSANTTTPVYLGEVESTRKIYKTVLTGQESWDEYGTGTGHFYYIALSPFAMMNLYPVCSHYTTIRVASEGKQLRIYETYESTTDFKTYLQQQYAAGTPVTVWYVLSSATTGILNEPLRKIGDYADTVSGITIPTTTGKDTFDVLTTLKPSEVELTYTGWHDASVQEKSRNLFDYTTMATSITGYYLKSDGTTQAEGSWNISGYIPCDGINFVLSKVGGNAPSMCFYDNNKQFISGVNYNTGGSQIKKDIFATASNNAKYIRFSYMVDTVPDNLSAIILNTGSTALPYEPYWK